MLSLKWRPCQVVVVVGGGAEVEEEDPIEEVTEIKLPMEAELGELRQVRGRAPVGPTGDHAILTHLQIKPVLCTGNSGKVLISVWSQAPAPGRTSSPRSPDQTNESPTSST